MLATASTGTRSTAVPGPKPFSPAGQARAAGRGADIRGVIRPVTLEAVYLGHVAGPRGGQRAVFTADGTLDWEDWGLAWNVPLDGGALLVSKRHPHRNRPRSRCSSHDHWPACLATAATAPPGQAL